MWWGIGFGAILYCTLLLTLGIASFWDEREPCYTVISGVVISTAAHASLLRDSEALRSGSFAWLDEELVDAPAAS